MFPWRGIKKGCVEVMSFKIFLVMSRTDKMNRRSMTSKGKRMSKR